MSFFNRSQAAIDFANAENAKAEAEAARYAAENPYEVYLPEDNREQLIAEKNKNPNAYYSQVAQSIGDKLYNANFGYNLGGNRNTKIEYLQNQLEGIKKLSPQAYYSAKLKYLGQQMGWQIGQNRSDRNAPTEKEIRDLVPKAISAGLSADQINSIVGNSLNAASSANQQRIATAAADGGGGFSFTKDVLPGLAFVGGSAAAMTGLGAALSAGAGAGAAGGAGALETAGASGLLGGGAFVPAAGSGASFVLPGAVAAGSAAAPLTTAEILSSTGFTPTVGSGASFGITPGAAYTTGSGLLSGTTGTNTGTAAMEELFGPTYQELGITGLEAGQMGPTYAELGLTGLNTEAAISAADIAAAAAQTGIPTSTLTSLAKQYGLPALKAILGGTSGGAAGTAAGTTGLGNILGGLLGGATNIALTDQQRQAIQNAYNTQSQAVGAAGTTAAQRASFTPVGMTTAFGSSNFQYDPTTGKLVSAGYAPSSQISNLQNALFGQAAQTAQQAGQVTGQVAPIQAGAQSMFGLANKFLPTSSQAPQATAESQAYYKQQQALASAARPSSFATTATPEAQAMYKRLNALSNQVLPTSYDTTAAAQRYMQQQQGLLAPGRQQTLAQLQAGQYGAGRSGLATGGTAAGYGTNAQGLLATNPQMAAYYNAMAQQDAQLAAAAEQQARTNLQSDITLGTNLGTQGLSTLTTSQQQALQNALSQGQFAQTAGNTGLNALTQSQQQQYTNMMNNLTAGQNLYNTGTNLLGAAQTRQTNAYQPLTSQMGLLSGMNTLAQQPFTLSSELAKAQAAAGTSAGQLGLTGATNAAQLGAQGSLLSNAAMQGTYNQLGQTAQGLGQQFGNLLTNNPTIQSWLS